MCLAIPAEVLEMKENDIALVDIGGVRKDISLMLTEGVEVGDYVLVHAGFAIETIDRLEAEKTLQLLQEYAGPDET